MRAVVSVPADVSEEDLKERALENPKIRSHIDGKEIRKIIVVPKKLVNVVAK